jgi:hypothetical protein
VKLIELWNLTDPHFGIIVLGSTGFVWTNQVGGTSCAHPRAEGIYIPLPTEWLPHSDFQEDPLYDLWTNYDPLLVEQFLQSEDRLGRDKKLQVLFAPITDYQIVLEIMEEEKLFLAEAWVPVKIIGSDEPIPSSMIGEHGILTYFNSD